MSPIFHGKAMRTYVKVRFTVKHVRNFYALVKVRTYITYVTVNAVDGMHHVAFSFVSSQKFHFIHLMTTFAKKITIIALKKTIYGVIIYLRMRKVNKIP